MTARTIVLTCVLCLGLCIIASGKKAKLPTTNAFCKIVWLFGIPCCQANKAIVSQIKAMGSYTLYSSTVEFIEANHTSAVGQTENVNFTMVPTTMVVGCRVEGGSVSSDLFTLFDNGTNYCNLRNVITGSGLTRSPGFMEFTNEWICLGCGLSAC